MNKVELREFNKIEIIKGMYPKCGDCKYVVEGNTMDWLAFHYDEFQNVSKVDLVALAPSAQSSGPLTHAGLF